MSIDRYNGFIWIATLHFVLFTRLLPPEPWFARNSGADQTEAFHPSLNSQHGRRGYAQLVVIRCGTRTELRADYAAGASADSPTSDLLKASLNVGCSVKRGCLGWSSAC